MWIAESGVGTIVYGPSALYYKSGEIIHGRLCGVDLLWAHLDDTARQYQMGVLTLST